ncbi:MAG: S8 family peptidase [Bacillota bacterium]|nr:S8 family peptidase [Bacillota bacterium]MDW7683542.1 S8 family peptidase [Bacillota bacterium]
MVFQEINWVRSHANKLCPALRRQILGWYRPTRNTPCFVSKPVRAFKRRWHKIPVIVQLDENYIGVLSVQSVAQSAGCKMKRDLRLIDSFSSSVNAQSLQRLVQKEEVKKVWYDGDVRAVLDVASPTINSDTLWESGYTGKGVTIAVLDTGVYDHPDLSGRIKAFRDFVKNKDNPYDDNGHGTHVCGCAAASGETSGNLYKSPAPEAWIVGVKVLSKVGSGSLSTVIEGVQWCIDQKERLQIRIINLSLGSDAYQSYKDDPVCQAVEKAWHSGIAVLAAAGNSGPEPRTVNSPGISPIIITVGAASDRNTAETDDDSIASFSSRGPTIDDLPKPDVLAPGVNIIALRSPGSFIDKQNKETRVDQWHTSLSGTSMATPVCAGLAAQLLVMNPELTPDDLRDLLMQTARQLNGYGTNDQGSGVVDGQKAMNSLR